MAEVFQGRHRRLRLVGSKVAVQLARSGVRSFVLVDGDVLSAGNLVRNELDWRSVGVHKAPALGARIQEVNADCTTPPGPTRSAGRRAARWPPRRWPPSKPAT